MLKDPPGSVARGKATPQPGITAPLTAMARMLFTSESVSMGHPDKVADQVSDAILDACLAGDSESRVACETLVTTNLCVVAGEITTKTKVDYEAVARKAIRRIGYTDGDWGMDGA